MTFFILASLQCPPGVLSSWAAPSCCGQPPPSWGPLFPIPSSPTGRRAFGGLIPTPQLLMHEPEQPWQMGKEQHACGADPAWSGMADANHVKAFRLHLKSQASIAAVSGRFCLSMESSFDHAFPSFVTLLQACSPVTLPYLKIHPTLSVPLLVLFLFSSEYSSLPDIYHKVGFICLLSLSSASRQGPGGLTLRFGH